MPRLPFSSAGASLKNPEDASRSLVFTGPLCYADGRINTPAGSPCPGGKAGFPHEKAAAPSPCSSDRGAAALRLRRADCAAHRADPGGERDARPCGGAFGRIPPGGRRPCGQHRRFSLSPRVRQYHRAGGGRVRSQLRLRLRRKLSEPALYLAGLLRRL